MVQQVHEGSDNRTGAVMSDSQTGAGSVRQSNRRMKGQTVKQAAFTVAAHNFKKYGNIMTVPQILLKFGGNYLLIPLILLFYSKLPVRGFSVLRLFSGIVANYGYNAIDLKFIMYNIIRIQPYL